MAKGLYFEEHDILHHKHFMNLKLDKYKLL